MNEPLISVILAVYQAEKYIERCINSILNQSYRNIELIILDDGSTDESGHICDEIGRKDNRVFVVHKENEGPYWTRKKGIMLARGKYITFVDADDQIECNYIYDLYSRLYDKNADVCCSKMVFVNELGEKIGSDRSIPRRDFDFDQEMDGKQAFCCTVPEWNIGMNGCLAVKNAWDYAYKRTSLSNNIGFAEDENVSRFILLWSNKVVFCKAQYFYTINSSSLTHAFNSRIFELRDSGNNLSALIKHDFGTLSEEYFLTEVYCFRLYVSAFGKFFDSMDNIPLEKKQEYLQNFIDWHNSLNWERLKNRLDFKHYYSHRFWRIEFMLFLLYKRKVWTYLREVIK